MATRPIYDQSAGRSAHKIKAIASRRPPCPLRLRSSSRYLDEQRIDYEVVEHPERFTAAAEARAVGAVPQDAAKDVVFCDGTTFILAVIPASERLDLRKVRALLDGEDARGSQPRTRSPPPSPSPRSAPCRPSARSTTSPRSSISACSNTTGSFVPPATIVTCCGLIRTRSSGPRTHGSPISFKTDACPWPPVVRAVPPGAQMVQGPVAAVQDPIRSGQRSTN